MLFDTDSLNGRQQVTGHWYHDKAS